MIEIQCEESQVPSQACTTSRCPESGCKLCQMLVRWYKAQDAFLDLTMRLEED